MKILSILFSIMILTLAQTAQSAEADLPYPRRELDRPFVIPGYMREFRFGGELFLQSQTSGGTSGKLGLEPILQYESGHSENFAWFFNPLPIGFKYQFLFNDHHRLGLRAYYEYFAYGVSLNYRFRFLQQAIEIEGHLDQMNIFFVKSKTQELIVKPIFQLSDTIAMMITGRYGRYGAGSDYINAIFNAFLPDSSDPEWTTATGLTGGVELQASVSPSVDLKAGAAAHHFFSGDRTSDALSITLITQVRF